MREILFRGKRVSGNKEWIFGNANYYPNLNRWFIRLHPTMNVLQTLEDEIVANTIGQYTGLIDKNGKRIFEGDIVDVEYDIQYIGVAAERIGLFTVVFNDGCFMKEKPSGGLFHFIPSDKCKVIGNIHDNPELLEKENKK